MNLQILEEVCHKENMSPPMYTSRTTGGHDQETGREIGLFLYKIMLPALFGNIQLTSNRLMRNVDDAKNDAAEFCLMQIFPQQIHQANNREVDFTSPEKVSTLSNGLINPTNSDTQLANNSTTMNVISSSNSDQQTQNNFLQIPGEGGFLPIQQYILDPSGQYLMQYPTSQQAGWH